jgi:NitT/TauT family transport system substrate-binding protein
MTAILFRIVCKSFTGVSLAAIAFTMSLSAQAAETMKIGTVVWVGYGPFYVADELGLYKDYGIEVELQFFNDPALIPPAMAGGAVDGGMLTYDQIVGTVAKGLNLKVVMPIDFSDGGDAIVADVSIKSVKDFQDKKIGFNPLSPSDFLLAYALQSNGMDEEDIQVINMTPEAIPGAMASGSLPIGVTYEPNVSRIIGMGDGKLFHVVYSSKEAPGLITDVLVFNEGMISEHREAISGIIQGYLAGLAYMKDYPKESAAIIGKVLGVSANEAITQMEGIYNIPLEEMPKNFQKSDSTLSFYGSGAIIAGLLKKNDQIPVVPDFADTFDASFIESLTK